MKNPGFCKGSKLATNCNPLFEMKQFCSCVNIVGDELLLNFGAKLQR